MALNSSELPLGSWKNIVHCSPGWPVAQSEIVPKFHPAATGSLGSPCRHSNAPLTMMPGCLPPPGYTSCECQAILTLKSQVWLQNERDARRLHALRQLMELLHRQRHPKVRHGNGVPVDCMHTAGLASCCLTRDAQKTRIHWQRCAPLHNIVDQYVAAAHVHAACRVAVSPEGSARLRLLCWLRCSPAPHGTRSGGQRGCSPPKSLLSVLLAGPASCMHEHQSYISSLQRVALSFLAYGQTLWHHYP